MSVRFLEAVCIVALLTCGAPASATATEVVLAWDNGGTSGEVVQGDVGTAAAVVFQAPEWANAVVGARLYLEHCSIAWTPEWPYPDSVYPFDVCIWRPGIGEFGAPGELVFTSETCSAWECLNDTWVEVRFEEPVDLTDGGVFPERQFFLGIGQQHRYCPRLQSDIAEPVWGNSWLDDLSGWSLHSGGDLRIQAVVSDTLNVPVEMMHWGRLKALYRCPPAADDGGAAS